MLTNYTRGDEETDDPVKFTFMVDDILSYGGIKIRK